MQYLFKKYFNYFFFTCSYLLSHYAHDAEVNSILERVRIHLIPSLNPDVVTTVPSAESMQAKTTKFDTKTVNGVELDYDFHVLGKKLLTHNNRIFIS